MTSDTLCAPFAQAALLHQNLFHPRRSRALFTAGIVGLLPARVGGRLTASAEADGCNPMAHSCRA